MLYILILCKVAENILENFRMIAREFLGVFNNAILKIRVIYGSSYLFNYHWEYANFNSNTVCIEICLEIYYKKIVFAECNQFKIVDIVLR